MRTVRSDDGTAIAYDSSGTGPALILVDGAMCTRVSGSKPDLVKLLSADFTVYSYDRRGRGDSGDAQPYAAERENEDIRALADTAGGAAYLFGHSSGASLAMEAALALGPAVISKLAMYDAPYNDDPGARQAWRQYLADLTGLLAAGRNGEAVARFMTHVGIPAGQIEGIRQGPGWASLEAVAPTLAYDHAAILGEDGSVPAGRAAQVALPVLVLYGAASFPFMADTARALSQAMPHATLRGLAGQTHDLDPAVLAPVLAGFFNS
ncbi:MAG: alpha/beta hydrolase [Streptosporangiaceae bacterium]|jgi:pimeloyl-ACP methyl ester carboxylesterase